MDERIHIKGTSITISMPMEVDHHISQKIREDTDKLIQTGNIRNVVFDMKNTYMMDSSGIGLIFGRYKNMRFMGGKVIAVNANERVRKILTLSGLHKIIDVYEGLPAQPKRG